MNTKGLANLLTKTDFKLARECPTKLYFSKHKYTSSKESSEYLEMLQEGGHIVGELARIIHPDGIFIGLSKGIEAALDETRAHLQKESVTLFEAVFISQGMLAVVDILEKRGRTINLIEVKSKSFDSREENQIVGKKGGIKSDWQEYIEDVAFQELILKRELPECSITPFLMLPDKAKTTQIDQLASYFRIEKAAGESGDFFKVRFEGNRKELIADNFLTRVNVKDAAGFISPLVELEANKFVSMINPTLKKIQNHLGKHCKDCEFRTSDPKVSGFHECWGDLAETTPHIFDLYFGGALKIGGKFLFDELIAQKKVSLFDVPLDLIKGTRGKRQLVQINGSREGKEWIDPALKEVFSSFKYPLHFIDFETSISPIPYHKGMRPYEQIAFQWSCHTIANQGSAPQHAEWINLEDSFPSFKFAESLMDTLSAEGTIFMWASHENTVLTDIRRQMGEYEYENAKLFDWLSSVIITEETPGRLVDMNEICLNHYFHPQMKGKTSLKATLPSVWKNNTSLHSISFLKRFLAKNKQGEILSPYETLETIEIEGINQVVREGTGAMTAYKEMMYGLSRGDPNLKKKWSKLLLQYCELDTLAMVIVFLHWENAVKA